MQNLHLSRNYLWLLTIKKAYWKSFQSVNLPIVTNLSIYLLEISFQFQALYFCSLHHLVTKTILTYKSQPLPSIFLSAPCLSNTHDLQFNPGNALIKTWIQLHKMFDPIVHSQSFLIASSAKSERSKVFSSPEKWMKRKIVIKYKIISIWKQIHTYLWSQLFKNQI